MRSRDYMCATNIILAIKDFSSIQSHQQPFIISCAYRISFLVIKSFHLILSLVFSPNNSPLQPKYHAVMAWLPAWGSTTKPEGAPSSDSIKSEEYRPPGRQTRAKCWDSRDVFNECLNRNNILDAIKDKEAADKACGKESDLFEKNCASSWVSLVCFCFQRNNLAILSS